MEVTEEKNNLKEFTIYFKGKFTLKAIDYNEAQAMAYSQLFREKKQSDNVQFDFEIKENDAKDTGVKESE